jgi:hypothetical protein
VTDDRTWRELTTAERLEVLRAGFVGEESAEDREQIMGRVAGYFLGRRDLGPNDAMNALLREAWRQKHGNTEEWDANARAAGMTVPVDARADLLARKSEMTPEEFAAAEAKLYAPEPVRVGHVEWSAGVVLEQGGGAIAYVRVVWPSDGGVPDVFVDGRKTNAKHRRRWLRRLEQAGVTRESVIAAETSGRTSVAEA